MSHASLGGAPDSAAPAQAVRLAAPRSESPAARSAQAAAPWSAHQSVDANGVTIREYVLPSNVVFAVTWEGPIRPDMKALLGSYFPNYVNAGESRVRGPGPMVEGNDDFRVESAGRLGHFYGVAYLPRLKPASVRPGDLK
jgi:hypothetical protein